MSRVIVYDYAQWYDPNGLAVTDLQAAIDRLLAHSSAAATSDSFYVKVPGSNEVP